MQPELGQASMLCAMLDSLFQNAEGGNLVEQAWYEAYRDERDLRVEMEDILRGLIRAADRVAGLVEHYKGDSPYLHYAAVSLRDAIRAAGIKMKALGLDAGGQGVSA